MAAQQAPGELPPAATRPEDAQPQRDWERVTAKNPNNGRARTTFRIDAPSPSQEVLAKHDAEITDQTEDQFPSDRTICF